MSPEHAQKLQEEPAIVCCKTEAGTIISPDNLEDPEIFPDLVDSGMLVIPENCLKIGQVLGLKLLKTVDSLTPLIPDCFQGVTPTQGLMESGKQKAVLKTNKKAGEVIAPEDLESPIYFPQLEDSLLLKLSDQVLTSQEAVGKTLREDVAAFTPITPEILEGYLENQTTVTKLENSSILKIKIAEGKGIDIEIPLAVAAPVSVKQAATVLPASAATINSKPKPIRKLVKKHFAIEEVKFGPETKIEDNILYIRENICQDAVKESELVKGLKLDIITPEKYATYSETIMDVQPIATKEDQSKLGEGVTRVLDGVVVVVTGTDETGVQIGEFGSSEGILEENIQWNRPGAPDRGEILIKTEVVIAEGTNMERPGPLAAHKATDYITQEIREVLKKLAEGLVTNTEEIVQYRRSGRKKVVIVKEIMGQGAMHDNLILPVEPVGVLGGKPNVDLGNIPVVLSPLEVLDGGIHALTCIGPASKECSRHYWREPLVIETMQDEELDLCGVVFIGSPQVNNEKFYVSERLGMLIEAMDVDGAIVTTEGFGNNHIDFASHIEQIGSRGIPVVGMSFCAVQGALVIGNKYMKYLVDNNKSEEGIENEILACNTLCQEDALRALAMLKTAIGEEEIKAAERKWNPGIKESNLAAIEKTYQLEVERV